MPATTVLFTEDQTVLPTTTMDPDGMGRPRTCCRRAKVTEALASPCHNHSFVVGVESMRSGTNVKLQRIVGARFCVHFL